MEGSSIGTPAQDEALRAIAMIGIVFDDRGIRRENSLADSGCGNPPFNESFERVFTIDRILKSRAYVAHFRSTVFDHFPLMLLWETELWTLERLA